MILRITEFLSLRRRFSWRFGSTIDPEGVDQGYKAAIQSGLANCLIPTSTISRQSTLREKSNEARGDLLLYFQTISL